MQLEWLEVADAELNGPLLFYNITCFKQDTLIRNISSSKEHVKITELSHSTSYSCLVSAVNTAGNGPATMCNFNTTIIDCKSYLVPVT